MDNATIISLCAGGDKEAMELLYRRYARRLMRVINRYVVDAQCAEDILHDGFVVIFTRIAEVRDPAKLEFWMGTLIKNLCLKYLSDLDVMTLLNEDTEMADIPDLDEILSWEELDAIINKLPEGYRTIFKLAVLEGKSHKEIGKILGIAPHTSSSQLYHAKQMLRRLIVERRRELGLATILLMLLISGFLLFNRRDVQPNLEAPTIVRTTAPSDPVDADSQGVNERVFADALTTPGGNISQPINTEPQPSVDEAVESALPQEPTTEPQEELADNQLLQQPDTFDTFIPTVPGDLPDLADLPIARHPLAGNTDRSSDWQMSAQYNDYNLNDIGSRDVSRSGWWAVNGQPSSGTNSPWQNGVAGDNNDGGNSGNYPSSPGPWDPIGPLSSDEQGATSPAEPVVASRGKISYGPTPTTYAGYAYTGCTASHDVPLVFSLTLSKRLTPRLSFETGLSYSYLKSNVTYSYVTRTVNQNVATSYVGVPVKLNCRVVGRSGFSLYATGGAMVDFPVLIKKWHTRLSQATTRPLTLPDVTPRVQVSLSGGLGIQYDFSPAVGVYIEPSARFNINNHSTLPSYWQEHPVNFSFPIGVRINL